MGRRSGSRGRQRVVNTTPTLGTDSLLEPPLTPDAPFSPDNAPDLVAEATRLEVEDRRTFHPEGGFKPPLRVSGIPSAVVRPSERRIPFHKVREFMEYPERMRERLNPWTTVKNALGFDVPENVLMCMRRKIRREIMFALPEKRRRKGAGARRRRNEWSDINC